MKIFRMGAELFHEDRRDELIVAFRYFANASTNDKIKKKMTQHEPHLLAYKQYCWQNYITQPGRQPVFPISALFL